MNIVYLLTSFKIFQGNSAGAARLMNMARAFSGAGCRVYLCSSVMSDSVGSLPPTEVAQNIFLLGREPRRSEKFIQRKFRQMLNPALNLIYLRKLHRLIRQNGGTHAIYFYPDTDFSMDLLVSSFLKGIWGHRVFADINELRKTMLGNRAYSKNLLKRAYQFFSFSFESLKYRIAEKMASHYDGLVVISKNLEEYFEKYNPNRLLLPILSNCNDLIPPVQPEYGGGDFQIGFTGQLATRKEGFENFYHSLSLASRQFPQIRLNLYGPIYESFERELLLQILPARYGLSGKISYHGNVGQQQVAEILRKQHLLVLPRPWNPQTHYGFSTKLSEYLVSGIPVLLTDVSDNALYIRDGASGLIVKPGDPEAMADKICHLIEHYSELAPKLSVNGFKVAREHFHYENHQVALRSFFFGERRP